MPIDDANLSPSKSTFEGSEGESHKLVEIGGVSGLPSVGDPITSPVRHGYPKATDVSTPDGKSTAYDPTKLPEDKILVMGKLKKQNTDWVEKGLSEYVVGYLRPFTTRSRNLLIFFLSVGNMRYIPSTIDPPISTPQRGKATKPMRS